MSGGGLAAGRTLVLAHRGASADAPENTLAAFRIALEQGADGVELDVWRCATGEVVVHHDPDTLRSAGIALRIARTPFQELQRLDVGAERGAQFRGERIPRLEDVLRALPYGIVNVELKSAGLPDPGLPAAVLRAIRAAGAERRSLVSSFDLALLATFRMLAPDLRCGVLVGNDPGWSIREGLGRALLRPSAIHPHHALADERRIAAWRARSLEVNVWTVDEPSEIERLARAGVTAVITNRPALAREVLRRLR